MTEAKCRAMILSMIAETFQAKQAKKPVKKKKTAGKEPQRTSFQGWNLELRVLDSLAKHPTGVCRKNLANSVDSAQFSRIKELLYSLQSRGLAYEKRTGRVSSWFPGAGPAYLAEQRRKNLEGR